MTLERLRVSYPDATLDTWRQLESGAWAHNTARVGEGAIVGVGAKVELNKDRE